MRCLSIRQPWAWLICAGKKTIENRVWQTPYRGLIAIHASTTKSEVGRLQKHLHTKAFDASDFVYGAIIGTADILDVAPYGREHEQDGFACGPYCFQLANGRFLRKPIPMPGKLNLFVLADDIATVVQNAETFQVDLAGASPEAGIANAFELTADPIASYASTIEELQGKVDGQLLYAMSTRMIELEPETGDGYLARLKLGTQTGALSNIETDIQTLLRLWPDDSEALACATDYYFNSALHAQAKPLMEKLLELHPDSPIIRACYGQSLFELGEIHRAEAELKITVDQVKDDPYIYGWSQYYLAELSFRSNSLPQAQKHVDEAMRSGLMDPALHVIAGKIARQKGDLVSAKQAVDAALQVAPEYQEAIELKRSLSEGL